MGTGTHQMQFIALDTINQKPVRFDVGFPVPLPDTP